MSAQAILFAIGTVIIFFWLVVLPFPLFIALLLPEIIEIIGDRSRDLTPGTVGKLCTCYCFEASIKPLESPSPFNIDSYYSSLLQEPFSMYDENLYPSNSCSMLQLPHPN